METGYGHGLCAVYGGCLGPVCAPPTGAGHLTLTLHPVPPTPTCRRLTAQLDASATWLSQWLETGGMLRIAQLLVEVWAAADVESMVRAVCCGLQEHYKARMQLKLNTRCGPRAAAPLGPWGCGLSGWVFWGGVGRQALQTLHAVRMASTSCARSHPAARRSSAAWLLALNCARMLFPFLTPQGGPHGQRQHLDHLRGAAAPRAHALAVLLHAQRRRHRPGRPGRARPHAAALAQAWRQVWIVPRVGGRDGPKWLGGAPCHWRGSLARLQGSGKPHVPPTRVPLAHCVSSPPQTLSASRATAPSGDIHAKLKQIRNSTAVSSLEDFRNLANAISSNDGARELFARESQTLMHMHSALPPMGSSPPMGSLSSLTTMGPRAMSSSNMGAAASLSRSYNGAAQNPHMLSMVPGGADASPRYGSPSMGGIPMRPGSSSLLGNVSGGVINGSDPGNRGGVRGSANPPSGLGGARGEGSRRGSLNAGGMLDRGSANVGRSGAAAAAHSGTAAEHSGTVQRQMSNLSVALSEDVLLRWVGWC